MLFNLTITQFKNYIHFRLFNTCSFAGEDEDSELFWLSRQVQVTALYTESSGGTKHKILNDHYKMSHCVVMCIYMMLWLKYCDFRLFKNSLGVLGWERLWEHWLRTKIAMLVNLYCVTFMILHHVILIISLLIISLFHMSYYILYYSLHIVYIVS